MHIKKPLVTNKQPTGLIFCIVLVAGLNSTNLEKLVKCFYLLFLEARNTPESFNFKILSIGDHSQAYFVEVFTYY